MSSSQSTLLQSLLTGSEPTSSVIVQDYVEASGRRLLKALVTHFASQHCPVHIFLLEGGERDWKTLRTGVICHDFSSDPLGWDSDSSGTTSGDSPDKVRLCELSAEACMRCMEGVRGVVMFDSLSPLLLQQSASSVSRILHKLGEYFSLVLSLVHVDLHEDHMITRLCHMTSTVITMQTLPINNLCSIYHRRKSGKVLKQMDSFTVSKDLKVTSTLYSPSTPSTTYTPSQLDPTANLTFDLTLTTKEKQDKANVVLPYTRPHITPLTGLQVTQGRGEVYYQPDEADDFDESDPDDDLDI